MTTTLRTAGCGCRGPKHCMVLLTLRLTQYCPLRNVTCCKQPSPRSTKLELTHLPYLESHTPQSPQKRLGLLFLFTFVELSTTKWQLCLRPTGTSRNTVTVEDDKTLCAFSNDIKRPPARDTSVTGLTLPSSASLPPRVSSSMS